MQTFYIDAIINDLPHFFVVNASTIPDALEQIAAFETGHGKSLTVERISRSRTRGGEYKAWRKS